MKFYCIKPVLVSLALTTIGGCFIEGGGCSGPFCFGVSTEICEGGFYCSDEETNRCPDADDIEVNSISHINFVRAQPNACSVASVPSGIVWNAELFTTADLHSLDMAGNNFVSPVGSNGLDIKARLAGEEYRYTSLSAAGGFASVAELFNGWLSDNQECEKVLSPAVTEFALACRFDSDSQYGTYWTLVMAGS